MKLYKTWVAAAAFTAVGGVAFGDTIDPITFSADLAVGESVTIEKTVVIEAAGTSSALIDVHFLFDTSGSMGGEIADAKTAASDILTGLSGFGDLATGVGVFSEGASLANPVPGNVINQDLTTNNATAIGAINAVTLNNPDGGGDFPERGQDATTLAADNVSWRPGSNRFIIALGDASWKNDVISDAMATAALDGSNVNLIGLHFDNLSASDPDSDDLTFAESVLDLGGSVFAGGTSPADIVDAILAAISTSFATYSEVTVGDLGLGLPEIGVSAVCTGADIGACNGALAEGMFDRSVDRTFTFDVTFERLADGDSAFLTHALVDGGIVASEKDRFPGGTIPLPAAGWMLLSGLVGFGAFGRRRKS